ncbi:hypothetical protein MGYG_01287 [Nannizzia gypsea CBS 118893]|uniref:Jacalin-type lectin domain-containing protein n=1 Tax=Arthroderma gypseum (strain ATCC MYA-4604 / CBS 118893) TaxID=535722 RepID=E5R003_ARTGP|nr:hypothetical protein MGYG_01287 [Nannizzia gypsea CBS 118893]EFQ98252.1 hypothetical protein MGYG_01287 [Nannizzia gypsea CBS 118893]
MASGEKKSSGMGFFKELRRRSKAGFHSSKPAPRAAAAKASPCPSLPTSSAGESIVNGCGGVDNAGVGANVNGHQLNGQLHVNGNGHANGNCNGNGNGISKTSTAESSAHSSSGNTPPPSIKPAMLSSSHLPYLSKSEGWLPPPPQRTVPISSQSCRNSMLGVHPSASTSTRNFTHNSPLAPRVLSISDNSWVNQKLLLLYGRIGDRDPQKSPLDGNITIHHLQDASFPSISWPVRASCFKALVHLVPGPNRIRLEYVSPKTAPTAAPHTSWININYLPLANSPPLQLAILLGSDSQAQYDSAPNKGANDLDNAVRKFRMAAYLWQAFTGEQMYRNNFGRRCFHFEEEWQTGSLSGRDTENGIMRSEAKVHIIRCDKTVDQLRALSTATTTEDGLFKVAMDAVRKYFDLRPGEQRYVSALLLDTHWDNDTKSLTAHAALGSSQPADLKLALFGSHGLHSYPSCLQEIVPCFSDCARTDTAYVANHNNECGSNWETASSSLGRHLHEVGRLFGCNDSDSGIMGPDYLRFNRTFMTWEPYSTRTKEQGARLLLQQDECRWNRLEALRFRFHPCFKLPTDPGCPSSDIIQLWSVDGDKILATSSAGIAFIEIFTSPQGDIPTSFIEYVDSSAGNSGVPKEASFTEAEIRAQLPDSARKSKIIRLRIYSGCLSVFTVADLSVLTANKGKEWCVKIPTVTGSEQTNYLPYQLPGCLPGCLPGEKHEVSFETNKPVTALRVYAEEKQGLDVGAPLKSTIAGIEFRYEDGSSQLFGSKGQGMIDDEYTIESRRGEMMMGFHLRADKDGVHGIGILTSFGRRSGIYGCSKATQGGTLVTPKGFRITGVTGTIGTGMHAGIMGFSLIIAR